MAEVLIPETDTAYYEIIGLIKARKPNCCGLKNIKKIIESPFISFW